MNKKIIMTLATLGMIGGGTVPMLFGDNSMLDGWGILGGIVGGFVGIWLGVLASKRFS